jgi:ABC-type dipeptide/oligopeptide/nickel transport system permease subunit
MQWRIYCVVSYAAGYASQFSSSIGGAVLLESSLSFLGLGIQPPTPSWGMMLNEARQFVLNYPYIAIAPGVVLLITVLGFNLLGDGLNDRLVKRRSKT